MVFELGIESQSSWWFGSALHAIRLDGCQFFFCQLRRNCHERQRKNGWHITYNQIKCSFLPRCSDLSSCRRVYLCNWELLPWQISTSETGRRQKDFEVVFQYGHGVHFKARCENTVTIENAMSGRQSKLSRVWPFWTVCYPRNATRPLECLSGIL